MVQQISKKASELDKKLIFARTRIKAALRDQGADKCAVACSFGKDSMLVLALVREFEPNINVVFNNTGVEWPETIKFKDRMVTEWGLNFHESKGEYTFFQLVEKYGFPSRSRCDPKYSGVPKCCEYLKERPSDAMYKQLGVKLIFTGITADESQNRFFLFHRCGPYYFAKKQGLWKCHPIMDFTEAEVYEAHDILGIPLNPAYKVRGVPRVGCMPCTAHLHWEEQMASANLPLYRKIQKMRGQVLIDGLEGDEE